MQKSAPAVSRPFFQPFIRDGVEVTRTRRHLPHWQREAVTYFVTFRLKDSMPDEAMDRWVKKRNDWLASHGLAPKEDGHVDLDSLVPQLRKEYRQRFGEGFQTELDQGYGKCLLREPSNSAVVEETFRFSDGARYQLGDFVIMPNHVHVLLVPLAGQNLGSILRVWKSFSAKRINEMTGDSGSLWQRESFDHIIRHRKQLEAVREYIRDNPAKARLPEGAFRLWAAEWDFAE